MKKIKKFLLTIAMTMALGTSAFAASGFEFILNVPLGVGITMLPKEAKALGIKGGAGFDAGVTAQLGYMAQVVNGFGISALFELGYAHDSFVIDFGAADVGKMSFALESLQVGLLPKFNIGAFSIGIGGGIKFPLGASFKYPGQPAEKIPIGAFMMFSPPVIGYVKATFDYSIFFTEKLALNVGLYLAGDIAKISGDMGLIDLGAGGGNVGISSFDIGVELGFKFGPKA